MQFISKGPEIPNDLIQSHEEGKVVFFTGAGISAPAGLPNFKGLTEQVFKRLNETPNGVEEKAIESYRYDTALGLLEARLQGERQQMREQLVPLLTPDLTQTDATRTHKALLELGQSRNGAFRLVTTNFDRLFDAAGSDFAFKSFSAPLLPIPKNTWDGLVYLHGHLPISPTGTDLDQLVLSSGDFGRAYLAERWAARFVSELFRNYTVCFVGYSIEDPVLRYMMDALAAERLLGGEPLQMYAFARGAHADSEDWQAKGVVPIMYCEHQHLHDSIDKWASIYRDGITGKEAIVERLGRSNPQDSSLDDDVAGRLLWALSDPCGAPAKRFADLDPLPSLDWLKVFTKDRFGKTNRRQFGLPAMEDGQEDIMFSLLSRPFSFRGTAKVALVGHEVQNHPLGPSLEQMARWLARHAAEPELLLWVMQNGGVLHPEFAWHVENVLEREDFPLALKVVWRMALSGLLRHSSNYEYYEWETWFKKEGLSPFVRLGFRHLLSPCVHLDERSMFSSRSEETAERKRPCDIFDTSVMLGHGIEKYAFVDLDKQPEWAEALPDLADDAHMLLRDALDLMHELGMVTEEFDRSSLAMPSISEHDQNRYFDTWTLLIRLTRDSWQATARRSPERARSLAKAWAYEPYPCFRRLRLFAATYPDVFTSAEAVQMLVHGSHYPLWSFETRREALRLIVSLAQRANEAESMDLQEAILKGPPRELARDEMTADEWNEHSDDSIWIRLAKYQGAGGQLSARSKETLDAIQTRLPSLELAADESDEFHMYFGGGTRNRPASIFIPEEVTQLAEWLIKHPKNDHWAPDNWPQLCKQQPELTAEALAQTMNRGVWLPDRWHAGLQTWADEEIAMSTWPLVKEHLLSAPDDRLILLANAVAYWAKHVAAKVPHDHDLTNLMGRLIHLHRKEEPDLGQEPMMRAVNHPIGMATEVLFHCWYAQELGDSIGLSEPPRALFTELCDPTVAAYRIGRVKLGDEFMNLYRVDAAWTKEHLLPLFDWKRSPEDARAVWYGWLWSGNLYWPLLSELKTEFTGTIAHYTDLGDCGKRLATWIAIIALDETAPFNRAEMTSLVHDLPLEGLAEMLFAMHQNMASSADQRNAFWTNRIKPFVKDIWPKTKEKNTAATGEQFARIALQMGAKMSTALPVLRRYVKGDLYWVLHELDEQDLCRSAPEACLDLLYLMDRPKERRRKDKLKQYLKTIAGQDQSLTEDPRYRKLLMAVA
jgi:hypothetical protein